MGGYPLDDAAATTVAAAEAALRGTSSLQLVIFALRGAEAYNAFARVLQGAAAVPARETAA